MKITLCIKRFSGYRSQRFCFLICFRCLLKLVTYIDQVMQIKSAYQEQSPEVFRKTRFS